MLILIFSLYFYSCTHVFFNELDKVMDNVCERNLHLTTDDSAKIRTVNKSNHEKGKIDMNKAGVSVDGT